MTFAMLARTRPKGDQARTTICFIRAVYNPISYSKIRLSTYSAYVSVRPSARHTRMLFVYQIPSRRAHDLGRVRARAMVYCIQVCCIQDQPTHEETWDRY